MSWQKRVIDTEFRCIKFHRLDMTEMAVSFINQYLKSGPMEKNQMTEAVMSADLDYPYLLAVHTLCIDGQLHQVELQLLQSLAQKISVDPATAMAAELILAQDDHHLGLDFVLQRVTPAQHHRALSLAALAAQFDGTLNDTEQRLLIRLQRQWEFSDDIFFRIRDSAYLEAQILIADFNATTSGEVYFGKKALLSGPKYDKAIAECRDLGLRDIKVADTCIHATVEALREIGAELDGKIAEVTAKIGDKPAEAAREALRIMQGNRAEIERVITQEIQDFQERQNKKRRAMTFYTIAFMGRSKAGKSTLHAVVTGSGWDKIGVGRQNTTRLNRVYEQKNIRIIDTPGIATPGGEALEKIAKDILDEVDLICFVVTNNNQQTAEFEFLKQLREKGKPLLVLLNVKADLSHPVRLKRFLDKPDKVFSDDKDQLGGHIDRIRRDAAEHYGTSNFPIIPVQLLAAQIALQQPEHEHAEALMKASRFQKFLDAVRLSVLNEGLLRRSHNLLGSTVVDIEHLRLDVKERSDFSIDFSRQIRARAEESALRLKKAQEDHAQQLRQDLCSMFAALQHRVPDFAENHWDSAENVLNKAWLDEIHRFGVAKKINAAQEKATEAFSEDIKDLLIEVGQEINLQQKFSFSAKKLNAQNSSVWLQKTLQWGSGVASLGIGVLAIANIWNPGGWVMAGVALIGLISSLFESKASKRRKAVAKISNALEFQIEQQKMHIVEAALKHFSKQCRAGSVAVQEYFLLSADGLAFVGQTFERGADKMQKQCNILNINFAARILSYAGKSPSESSTQILRAQINEVHRKVGERIDIYVSAKMKAPKIGTIESVIQEKITLKKTGV